MSVFAMAAGALNSSAIQAGTDIFNSVLSKNGVSPSFFSTFKFLSFLDNSTSQWKSRLATLRNYTPEQRISFYIDKMMNNGPFHGSCVQYAELFGSSYDGKSGIDDRGRVPVELLEMFNILAEDKYFKGKDTAVDGHTYQKGRILNRLDLAPDYQQVLQKRTQEQQQILTNGIETAKIYKEKEDTGASKSDNTVLYILLAVVVVVAITVLMNQKK